MASIVFARPFAISMYKSKLVFVVVMLKTTTLEISSATSMQPYKRVTSRHSSQPQPIVLSTDDLRWIRYNTHSVVDVYRWRVDTWEIKHHFISLCIYIRSTRGKDSRNRNIRWIEKRTWFRNWYDERRCVMHCHIVLMWITRGINSMKPVECFSAEHQQHNNEIAVGQLDHSVVYITFLVTIWVYEGRIMNFGTPVLFYYGASFFIL